MAPARERIVAGLMSGTSADGIDVAVIRLSPEGSPTLLGGTEQPYDPELRATILACAEPGGGDSRTIAELHFRLATAYADALASLHYLTDLDLTGCHGQTIAHWPTSAVPATFQAGSGPALAVLTGVPVVHDFRSADVALGGQGAPLIPFVDYHLFADVAQTRSIGVLNLGGIANITLLPQGIAMPMELLAFDTGPANMLIDELSRALLDAPFDRDGLAASRGTVDHSLLHRLLKHEFFHRPLPRSAGREEFGAAVAHELIARGQQRGLSSADLLATATAFSAHAIERALADLSPGQRPVEIILGGGGASNKTLVAMLEELLPDITFTRHAEYGWPDGLKEAIGFALLADAAVRGVPTALPNVTGVREALVLGAIAPGRPPRVWPDWIASG